jgi:GDPmannose 4,6-dehydratase
VPTVVIFGASGQDGHYLSELYKEQGWRIVPVGRSENGSAGDVRSFDAVSSLVREYTPEIVYHVAATSTTRHDALFQNHETVGTGTLNVLEAVRRWSPASRVFLAGSGVQFENSGDPIHESTPFAATSAYAVERIHTVYAARYFRSLGVRAYVGFLFHHESPLRKPTHVSQKIVQSVKRIAAGNANLISLGDISVQKEWGFAGDIARGMATLVDQDDVFEAVIGTGKAYSIEQWLEACFGFFGMDWRPHVTLKDDFTPEYHRLVSNPRTMNSLGWAAKVGFTDLARLMLQS